MNFLTPWAFGFAAIGPVIVLLYLLKLRRRALPVSTLMFWERVLRENRRTALFQKLRQFLSLLLHLFIFALILLALSRPSLDREIREGSSVVLVLDTRARMQATELGGDSRLKKAIAAAIPYAHRAGPNRQVAVLSASAAPRVEVPFTGDEKLLQDRLAHIVPTDAGGDLLPTLQLASEMLAARRGDKRIVLVTDSQPAGLEMKNLQAPLQIVPVGTPQDNVAITRFAARALPGSPETVEILLEVQNFGASPARGNIELSSNTRVLDVHSFALGPGEKKVEVFPLVARDAATSQGEMSNWLIARTDTPDALTIDNVAFATLPAREPVRVLLVTKGNWFLEKVLAADSHVRFELLTPDVFRPEMAEQFDVTILHDWIPAGFTFEAASGNILFIGRSPFAASQEMVEQPSVVDTDSSHPVLRNVHLENVTVARAWTLGEPTAREEWLFSMPIRSSVHPLMITAERSGQDTRRRIASFAFDFTDTDLPLRVAFPLLITNTLQWLTGSEALNDVSSIRAGSLYTLGSDQAAATEPLLATSTHSLADLGPVLRGEFQPLRNGYYQLISPGKKHWLAVNTFDEQESNLRLPPPALEASQPSPILEQAVLSGWAIWRYLAFAALGLFTAEWWLFHRRRTE